MNRDEQLHLYKHYRDCDWFGLEEENESAGVVFRAFCELSRAFQNCKFESTFGNIVEWVNQSGLDLDEVRWHAFKALDSSVGDLMSLVQHGFSLTIPDSHAEVANVVDGTFPSSPDPKPLFTSGSITESWRQYLVQLQSALGDLSTKVHEFTRDASVGRSLIFRGFILSLEILRLVDCLEYAKLLTEERTNEDSAFQDSEE